MAIIAVTITISTIYTTALADTTGYTGSKATTATAVIILLQKLDAVQVDKLRKLIDHFTVVCSVAWPLDGSGAGVGLVLMRTPLLLSCKCT